MVMQTPPPPSISPRQMNLLRIVASMAWADGHLASEEVDVMLDRFSGIFAKDAPQRQHLREELQAYMTQNIPLEELTPRLQSEDERKLVLKLGYEVICSSARTPDEAKINDEEAIAYQRLVDLLGLSSDAVHSIEAEVATSGDQEGIVDSMTRQLEQFMHG